MISYNAREWFGIFRLHKADTFRILSPFLAGLAVYSVAVVVIEQELMQLPATSLLKEHLKGVPVMHTLLGFAISMLLVFRTNTAYDRWWEGRRLWGALVNNSRNLALKIKAFAPADDDLKLLYAQLIARFAYELRSHLRSERVGYELDDKPHPEIPDFNTAGHVPAQVAGLIMQRTGALVTAGLLSHEQLLVMNPELTSFMDIAGACERIRNTPIPYSYSAFIKKFIFVYVVTLPLGFTFTLGYITIPVVMFIFYVLASLEIIAEEIEEPFGTDSNDLPLGRICETIEKNVREILLERNEA